MVTGIWCRRVTSAAVSATRRWTAIPARLRVAGNGTETSITPDRSRPISQSAAALLWLSTASAPQLSTAAIQRPKRLTLGRPTA